jgi:hypothetical protein
MPRVQNRPVPPETPRRATMPSFKRLRYDDALNMTRGELLNRVMIEQPWWFQQIDAGRCGWDDAGFQEFRRIMHLLDPGEAIAEALRVVKGEPGTSYWDQRPAATPEEATTDER